MQHSLVISWLRKLVANPELLYSLHCTVYFWPVFVYIKTLGTPKSCIALLTEKTCWQPRGLLQFLLLCNFDHVLYFTFTLGTPKSCVTLFTLWIFFATQRSLTLDWWMVVNKVYTLVLTSTSLYKFVLTCLLTYIFQWRNLYLYCLHFWQLKLFKSSAV